MSSVSERDAKISAAKAAKVEESNSVLQTSGQFKNDLDTSKLIVAYTYVAKQLKENPSVAIDFMKNHKHLFVSKIPKMD